MLPTTTSNQGSHSMLYQVKLPRPATAPPELMDWVSPPRPAAPAGGHRRTNSLTTEEEETDWMEVLAQVVSQTSTSTAPTSGQATAPTLPQTAPARAPEGCDCLIRMSGFCMTMHRLVYPESINPGLVWSRTLKEVKDETVSPGDMD